MKAEEIKVNGVYSGKDGTYRIVIGIFWSTSQNKRAIPVENPIGAEIEYLRCDEQGNIFGQQNSKFCSNGTFKRWATKKVK